MIEQIRAEIGAQRSSLQRKYKAIKTTEGRPKKYYYTSLSSTDAVKQAEENQAKSNDCQTSSINIKEQALYPLLSNFLASELGLRSKRIDERRSRNSKGPGGNKWLFPDLVALEDLTQDWESELKQCVQLCGDKKIKLWSFEVKILVNRSNIREVFFQTVSNSSWANFAYLVATQLEGADTLKELRILASLHGIGFIQLDINNPAESQTLIPAQEKNTIDWNTVNRLTQENKHFKDYIKTIRQFHQTGEIKDSDWEEIKSTID